MTEPPLKSTRQRWDEKYAEAERVWSGKVNPTLREVAARLEPATALDVGCGEGGDAVWLAEQAWTVVGLDLSPVALERAAAAAAERGVGERCTWVAGDIEDANIPKRLGPDARFDLVTTHYVHEPRDVRAAAWLAEAAAVAPGGILLVVGHHPDDEHPPGRGPRDTSVLFTPDEVEAVLAGAGGLDVEEAEVRTRTQDTADGPLTRRDTVVIARRR